MTTEILTTKLRNGRTVLAKNTKYGPTAYTYANYKQAYKKAEQLRAQGIACDVTAGHPIFIAIN